jgi:PLAT/LH2 domain
MHLSWLYQSPSNHFHRYSPIAFCRSLGLLNYFRLWHDNTGQGNSASWFVKYIIVRDLQTMSKSHFLCQRWFAVEKDDGMVWLNSLFFSRIVLFDLD